MALLLVFMMLLGSLFSMTAFADESAEPGGEETPGEETPGEQTPGEETPGEETPGEEGPTILIATDAIESYLTTKYETDADKLASMQLMLTRGNYELYCDPFSGEVGVKNTANGQILLTNPYDVANVSVETTRMEILQQLSLTFENIAENGKVETFTSYADCARYAQLDVKNIKNGIRVEYTLGKIAQKKLMPYWIEASRFESMILAKIEDSYELGKTISYYDYKDPNETLASGGDIDKMYEDFPCTKKTYAEVGLTPKYDETGVDPVTGETTYIVHYFDPYLNGSEGGIQTKTYKMSDHLRIWIINSKVVASEKMMNTMEGYVKSYAPEYTYEERDFDIDLTGYVEEGGAVANFRMALEYSLTDTGFRVSLPANGIRYDGENFRLQTITILPYLGASGAYDGKFEGYTFIPDGSGAIIRNEDIMATGTPYKVAAPIYGADYAYHTLISTYNGKSEIIRMPVFGVVEKSGIPFETGEREIVPALNDDGTPSTDSEGNLIAQRWTVPSSQVAELRDVYGDRIMLIMLDEKTGEPVYRDKENPSVTLTPVTDGTADKKVLYYLYEDNAGKDGLDMRKIFYEIHPTPISGQDTYYVLDENGDYADLTNPIYDYNYHMQGFFAIVEEGESLAEIVSDHGGGQRHGYNSAYITVRPEGIDSYRLSEAISVGGGNNDSWTVVSERKFVGLFTMNVIMLYGEDGAETGGYPASYMGMANAYRDYLSLNRLSDGETGDSIPLYIESFGMIETEDTFMTIPVMVDTPLTTFDDLKSMYATLSDANITNVNFRLNGFENGGPIWRDYPTKIKFEKVLGGNKGYKQLLSDAKGKFGVYPEFDLVYTNGGAGLFSGFSYTKQTVRTIDGRYANHREYDATYQAFQYNGGTAVSASAFSAIFDKFTKALDKLGVDGLSVSTLGSDVNSDFDEDDPYNREDDKAFTIEMLDRLSEKYPNLMVDVGNAYSWKYVRHILNAPLDSSRYMNASQSVPFMGIVLHGYIFMAGKPTNMQGDSDYEILKILENGASPYYTLSYQNTAELKITYSMSQYYSVDFHIWQSEVISTYGLLNRALGDLQTSLIVNHEFIDGVRTLSAKEQLVADAHDGETLENVLNDYNTLLDKAIKDAIRSELLPEDYKIVTDEDGVIQIPETFLSKDEEGNTVVDKALAFEYTGYDAYLEENFDPYFDTSITNRTIVYEKFENGISFILNFNNFAVSVEYNGKTYNIGAYGFVKLTTDGSELMNYNGSNRVLTTVENGATVYTNVNSGNSSVDIGSRSYVVSGGKTLTLNADGSVAEGSALVALRETAEDGTFTITNYTDSSIDLSVELVIGGNLETVTCTVAANSTARFNAAGEEQAEN